jgi:hypothetical protein
MSISYPLALPSTTDIARMDFAMDSLVGESLSPFSGTEQTYVWAGDGWGMAIDLVPMARATAEAWVAFLAALNGKEGSFLAGDPLNTSPRGVGGGSPQVNGAGQVGRSLLVKNAPLSTSNWLRKGDWIQLGSGATARLHKNLNDVNTDGGGLVTLDIWPRLRFSPANSDPIVISSPVGLWMLADNQRAWSLEQAQLYGLRVSCKEDLRGV